MTGCMNTGEDDCQLPGQGGSDGNLSTNVDEGSLFGRDVRRDTGSETLVRYGVTEGTWMVRPNVELSRRVNENELSKRVKTNLTKRK